MPPCSPYGAQGCSSPARSWYTCPVFSPRSWYPVADILSAGIKIPNECIKEKDADKLNVEVKPGEFVLLVRKKIWLEGVQD